jgi:Leucine-rich repeat (LRR) protein
MKRIAVIVVLSLLGNFTLFSQNGNIYFRPKFTWLTLEDAQNKSPEGVKHLKISKKDLAGFPGNILVYKNLEALSLQGLKLTKLPTEVAELSNLTYLDLSKNKLESLPDSIVKLTKIEVLILNRNPLAYLPHGIGLHLTRLKALDLYDTEVSNLPDSFDNLETLKYVDFQGVQLRQEEIDELKRRFPLVKFAFDSPCNCFK